RAGVVTAAPSEAGDGPRRRSSGEVGRVWWGQRAAPRIPEAGGPGHVRKRKGGRRLRRARLAEGTLRCCRCRQWPGAGVRANESGIGGEPMVHDDALHQQAVERGDYADETLFDHDSLITSLIHFGDGSHGVRLDLPDRGLSLVVDTPAWLDLDT